MSHSKFLVVPITVALFFLGYGLSSLFLPKTLRAYGIWLTPWLGTVLVIVVGAALSLSKVGMDERLLGGLGVKGYHVILIISLVLLFYALLEKGKMKFFSLDNGVLFLIFFFGVLFVRSVSASSNLIQSIEYFREKGVIEKIITEKKLTIDTLQIGVPILGAFFESVFQTEIKQLMLNLAKVYYGLFALLVFIAFKHSLCKRSLTAAGITVILVLLAKFTGFYTVNLHQIIFSGMVLFLILLFFNSLKAQHVEKISIVGEDLTLGASLSALSSLNPAGFSAVLVLLLVAISVLFIGRRERKLWLKIVKVIVIAFILNPFTFGVTLETVKLLL